MSVKKTGVCVKDISPRGMSVKFSEILTTSEGHSGLLWRIPSGKDTKNKL